MTAKDIMTTKIISIEAKASIGDAIKMCVKNKVSGLVVKDEKDRLCGLLSEKDLLVAYDFLAETESSIEEFVTKEVVSIKENTPIEEIGRLLVQKNFKRVPVMKKDKIVGIVSRGDILRYLETNKISNSK